MGKNLAQRLLAVAQSLKRFRTGSLVTGYVCSTLRPVVGVTISLGPG